MYIVSQDIREELVMESVDEKIYRCAYGELSDSDLREEHSSRCESAKVDSSYGIQNAMGDAIIGNLQKEMARRGIKFYPHR